MKIRPALASDRDALVDIWLASVRATHRFLAEGEIQALLPIVRGVVLEVLEVWVLEAGDRPIGFMGLADDSLEALFISPGWIRRGGGRRLLEHARRLKGRLKVDVNEQNPEAVAFYIANGFEVVGRSPVDGGGRPYPLLHLRELLPAMDQGAKTQKR